MSSLASMQRAQPIYKENDDDVNIIDLSSSDDDANTVDYSFSDSD